MANRRPLSVREWPVIKTSATWLSGRKITPNQISIASIAFAFLCAVFLLQISVYETWMTLLWGVLAVSCILGRALCNIFDGMVAVEGGKSTPSGEMFNDMPDRISDTLMLVAAGYVVLPAWGPELGWFAALMAMGTAYTRTLVRGMGAPSDFQGPMAKTHRMAVLVVAILATSFWDDALYAALIIIIVGCAITIWNRAYAAYVFLEKKSDNDHTV